LGTVRHCGFNPQSPDYNAFNTGIAFGELALYSAAVAGQARNDESTSPLPPPKEGESRQWQFVRTFWRGTFPSFGGGRGGEKSNNKHFNNKYKFNKLFIFKNLSMV